MSVQISKLPTLKNSDGEIYIPIIKKVNGSYINYKITPSELALSFSSAINNIVSTYLVINGVSTNSLINSILSKTVDQLKLDIQDNILSVLNDYSTTEEVEQALTNQNDDLTKKVQKVSTNLSKKTSELETKLEELTINTSNLIKLTKEEISNKIDETTNETLSKVDQISNIVNNVSDTVNNVSLEIKNTYTIGTIIGLANINNSSNSSIYLCSSNGTIEWSIIEDSDNCSTIDSNGKLTINKPVSNHTVQILAKLKEDDTKIVNKTITVTYMSGNSTINVSNFVDLGLPSGTLYAASDLPSKYAFGEILTKSVYSKDTYKWYKNGNFIKYFGDEETLSNDYTLIIPEDDIASVLYRGCRIPSWKQLYELGLYTDGKQDGDNYVFKSKVNGNSISFPICWITDTSSPLYSEQEGSGMRYLDTSVRTNPEIKKISGVYFGGGWYAGMMGYWKDKSSASPVIADYRLKYEAKPVRASIVKLTWIDLGLPSGNKWASFNLGHALEGSNKYYLNSGLKYTSGFNDIKARLFTDEEKLEIENKYTYHEENSLKYNVLLDASLEPLLDEHNHVLYNCIEGTIPSINDFKELYYYCSFEVIKEVENTNGFVYNNPSVKITSKINGNYIILPLEGWYHPDHHRTYYDLERGYYLTSEVLKNRIGTTNQIAMEFDTAPTMMPIQATLGCQYSIRPVLKGSSEFNPDNFGDYSEVTNSNLIGTIKYYSFNLNFLECKSIIKTDRYGNDNCIEMNKDYTLDFTITQWIKQGEVSENLSLQDIKNLGLEIEVYMYRYASEDRMYRYLEVTESDKIFYVKGTESNNGWFVDEHDRLVISFIHPERNDIHTLSGNSFYALTT